MTNPIRRAALGIVAKAAGALGGLKFLPDWVKEPLRDFHFRTLVMDGYLNSAAYACLRVLVESFAEPEMHVAEVTPAGDKVLVADHPLRLLLADPNPFMAEDEFWEFFLTFAGVGGNCYVWKERGAGGWPVALWPFSDGQMQPILDAREWIAGYKLNVGDGHALVVPRSEIIQWRWGVDPRTPQVGLSPLVAMLRDASMDNELRRYSHALAHNDAVPRTIVKVEGKIDDEVREQMQKAWQQSFGSNNRGAVAIVEKAVEVLRIGSSLAELEIENVHNIPESRIAAAYGGAPVGYLAGLNVHLQRSTFSNYEAAELALHTRVLMAKWRSVSAAFTRGLLREFTDDRQLVLEFDTSRVQAMQGVRRLAEAHALELMKGGLASRNEARARIGLDALAEDAIFEPSSSLPQPVVYADSPAAAKGRRPRGTQALRDQAVARRKLTRDLEVDVAGALSELQEEAIAALTNGNGRGH